MTKKKTALQRQDGDRGCYGQHKGSKKSFGTPKEIQFAETSATAYAMTAELRATEMRRTRNLFLEHPNSEYSRADLCEALGLPINHITRIVYDLIDSDFIEVVDKRCNPRSGVFVEMLRLSKNTIESPAIERLMNDYCFGQTKDRSVIFWQIDTNNRIRTGKIMQYNAQTGRRIKQSNGAIDWVHSKLKRDGVLPDDFNLSQCFFGEHLLKRYSDKMVCIVESEKSALIASGVMPEYIWLATGGKQNLKTDKCQILQGRKVILSPDLGAFDDWSAKALEISKTVNWQVSVSTLLEDIATEQDRAEGLDIADYLIRELSTSITPIVPKTPFSRDEIALHRLGDINPNVYNLINALELVGATGTQLRQTMNN